MILAGCGKAGASSSAAASSSAPSTSSASTASAAPAASASSSAAPAASYGVPIGLPETMTNKVVTAVNGLHKTPYTGPTATLKGTVRIDGDPPPDTNLKFPKNCRDSMATYGKLFRVGLDKTLADVMIAVTGYAGFVPANEDAVKVTIHGCVTPKRTYAITYGQRIEVSNIDKSDSYLPYLDGSPMRAVMVAVPQGGPIKLYPVESGPSHYMIRDQLPSGLVADVYVVNYATHDVTGLDGQYEIKGIPVGKVRVDAFLPVIAKTAEKTIELKEGENTLDFQLHFDLKKDIPAPAPKPTAAPSAPLPPGRTEPLPEQPR